MLRFEEDLKSYLLDNYPLIPLTAKQNAEHILTSTSLFQPEDKERKWVFELPLTVQKSFVMFFMKKKLEGETIPGIDELNDKDVALTERIITFCNNSSTTSLVENPNVLNEDDTLSSIIAENSSSKRARVIEEEEEEEDVVELKDMNKDIKSLLIVLTGLPGSGKTTLCEKLMENLGASMVIKRLCQDDIGKDACERESHMLLSDGGKIVIIDRTNINMDQRKTWVQIAKRYKCPSISITLNINKDICIKRAKSRKNHSLKEKDVPIVVGRLSKQFKPVTPNEGFDVILKGDDHNTEEEFYKLILEAIHSYGF